MSDMLISSALEEKIQKAESLDEVVQICTEEGITVTKEQLEAMLSSDSENDGELSAETLDNVSGGGFFFWLRGRIRFTAGGGGGGGGRGGGR